MEQKSFEKSDPNSITEGRCTRCYGLTSTTVKNNSRTKIEHVFLKTRITGRREVISGTE